MCKYSPFPLTILLAIVISSFILNGCNQAAPVITDEASYAAGIEKWQQQRLERLKDKNGWLTLAGLYWLEEGENSFGSDSANDIIFPQKADPFCGILVLDKGKVSISAKEGVEILHENNPVSEMELEDDFSDNTTKLQQGDLAWYIIKRGERYGIRIRDHKHPRLNELDHIPSYPIDPAFVVEASLEAFDTPKTMIVPTPVEGFNEEYECPGILKFRIKGRDLELHPFTSGRGYFLVIADETSGLDTYGAGRFMYAAPDSLGRIILDFNKAYNPPCAFSPYATCPMPPRENFLPAPIEAGEKTVHLY